MKKKEKQKNRNAKDKSKMRARWNAAKMAELNGERPFWQAFLLPFAWHAHKHTHPHSPPSLTHA